MKPIDFPQQTTVWAKNQPEYNPLAAFTDRNETISLWEFTPEEVEEIVKTGRLWVRQSNFGQPLQPIWIGIESPWPDEPETPDE